MKSESRCILLFDDDIASMEPLKNHLEKVYGFSVEATAEEGILQRLGHEHFDLIIVDLMIHTLNINEAPNVHFSNTKWHETGLEFIQRLRQGEFWKNDENGTSPDVPVLVLSGAVGFKILEQAKPLRNMEFLEKPTLLDEIDDYISRVLIK